MVLTLPHEVYNIKEFSALRGAQIGCHVPSKMEKTFFEFVFIITKFSLLKPMTVNFRHLDVSKIFDSAILLERLYEEQKSTEVLSI